MKSISQQIGVLHPTTNFVSLAPESILRGTLERTLWFNTGMVGVLANGILSSNIVDVYNMLGFKSKSTGTNSSLRLQNTIPVNLSHLYGLIPSPLVHFS